MVASHTQAIVLAGNSGGGLHPLTSPALPKALLPVANRPLLAFPLRLLEEAGLEDVLVVCEGEPAAAAVRSWAAQQHGSGPRLEVLRVPEGAPTLDALRAALDRVRTDSFVLLSGDLVAEPCLRPLLLAHHAAGAAVTALLARRKVSPSSETKPGKAPRGVDYIGRRAGARARSGGGGGRLAGRRAPERQGAAGAGAARRHGRAAAVTAPPALALPPRFASMDVRSNLVDARCYVFRTSVVQKVLASKPEMQHLQSQLLPYLVRRQAALPPPEPVKPSASASSLGGAAYSGGRDSAEPEAAGGGDAGGAGTTRHAWYCGTYLASEGSFCQRADSMQHYAEVNSAALGSKSTVGAGCMVGPDCTLGDRCSVKRSVIGPRCHIGSNRAPSAAMLLPPPQQIINSVLMEGAAVADNCHLQNSVVGAGCVLQEGASLRDCQLANPDLGPASFFPAARWLQRDEEPPLDGGMEAGGRGAAHLASLSSHCCCRPPSLTQSLASPLAQPCQRCTGGAVQGGQEHQLGAAAAQVVAALERSPSDATVQAAGLQLLLQLACCAECHGSHGPEVRAVLGGARAVQAAVGALLTCAGAAAEPAAAMLGGAAGQPAPAAAVAHGLQALRLMCVGDVANSSSLLEAGGATVVAASLPAVAGNSAGQEAALLLLGAVCSAPAAPASQLGQAAASVLACAEAAAAAQGLRLPQAARAAMWAVARLLQRVQERPAAAVASPPASDSGDVTGVEDVPVQPCAAELEALVSRGCTAALALLHCCTPQQDEALVQQCLDVLTRGAAAAVVSPRISAAPVLDTAAVEAVCQLAGGANTAPVQGAALRAAHALCRARCARLAPAEALSAPMACALSAALRALGAWAAAAGPAADQALPVLVHALGVIGALVQGDAHRQQREGPILAAALAAEQLGLLQASAAAAAAGLGRRPGLLDGAAQPPHERWQGASAGDRSDCDVAWEAGADAVRGLAAVLAAAPGGLNAADAEGLTLLHRLAGAGQLRLLELLLELGGCPTAAAAASGNSDSSADTAMPARPAARGQAGAPAPALDLLARTPSGGTALQLARRGGHQACADALEAATQAAANGQHGALPQGTEQEFCECCEGESGARRGRKHLATRDASFADEQGEEKAARVSSAEGATAPAAAAAAAAVAAADAEQREGRRRVAGSEYDLDLEEHRWELAVQQQQQQAAAAAADQSGGQGGAGSGPGTPDQLPDTPTKKDSDAPSNSSIDATPATACPAEVAASADALAPPPAESGRSSFAAVWLLSQQQQAARPQQALSFAGLQLSGGLLPPGAGAAEPGAAAVAGSAPASMLGEPGGSLLWDSSPQLSVELLSAAAASAPATASLDLPSPGHGSSPFAALAGERGGPLPPPPWRGASAAAAQPAPFGGHQLVLPAYGSAPAASGEPFPSLAASLAAEAGLAAPLRMGLPPLPSRSQSFGSAAGAAAVAAAAAAAGGAGAASPMDTDHILSARLQDALFVADSPTSAGGGARGLDSHQRQSSLFASLQSGISMQAAAAGGRAIPGLRRPASSGSSTLEVGSSPLRLSLVRNASGSLAGVVPSLSLGGDTGGSSSGADSGSENGGSGSSSAAARRLVPDPSSDESPEPTRHLWIGNLGTRTPRALLKSIFERFGCVDDVVTFPGRMYAFVNYRTRDEAVGAFDALQDQVVPELSGERRLLLKFRPAKKAAAHLRALGLRPSQPPLPWAAPPAPLRRHAAPRAPSARSRFDLMVDRDGNQFEPSPRIWLGNIAPTATAKSLTAVLSRFGPLTDAAVFPARIGPLGYAFVKFERLEDAVQAFETLNNSVVPPLSGSKQLKMRYKPANDGQAGKDGAAAGDDPARAAMVPSRHLWLGNITQKPSDEAVLAVFAPYGKVDSVRVFPVKAYAFVNYAEPAAAVGAMAALDGVAVPVLTGVKPLVMRYQQESHPAVKSGVPRTVSEPLLGLGLAAAAAAAHAQLVPGPPTHLPPGVLAPLGVGPASGGAAPEDGSDDGQPGLGGLMGRAQPNGLHGAGGGAPSPTRLAALSAFGLPASGAPDGLGGGGGYPPGLASLQGGHTQPHLGAAPDGGLLAGQLLNLQQPGASASQLSAVLSNLTALQRAQSLPACPPTHQVPDVQAQLHQLLLAQQQQQAAAAAAMGLVAPGGGGPLGSLSPAAPRPPAQHAHAHAHMLAAALAQQQVAAAAQQQVVPTAPAAGEPPRQAASAPQAVPLVAGPALHLPQQLPPAPSMLPLAFSAPAAFYDTSAAAPGAMPYGVRTALLGLLGQH
eukprot:scaffold9.g3033.t1